MPQRDTSTIQHQEEYRINFVKSSSAAIDPNSDNQSSETNLIGVNNRISEDNYISSCDEKLPQSNKYRSYGVAKSSNITKLQTREIGRIKEPHPPLSGRTLTSTHTRKPPGVLQKADQNVVGPRIKHKKPSPPRVLHALEGVSKKADKVTYVRQIPAKPKIRVSQRTKSVENNYHNHPRSDNMSPNILVEDEGAKFETLDL